MARVRIQDADGNQAAEFTPEHDESLGTQIQEHGVPLSIACGVGACGTCRGRIISGAQFVDKEANGPVQYPIEDDDVLTCIACVKEDAPEDAVIDIEIQNI